MVSPSPNGSNGGSGRDSGGRFARGNAGGPGDPYAKRTSEMRDAFMAAVTPDEMRQVARELLSIALTSNDERNQIAAAHELCNRILGRPAAAPSHDDGMKQQYPILVTTTAEAMKALEERRRLDPNHNDPYCGRKPLTHRNPPE